MHLAADEQLGPYKIKFWSARAAWGRSIGRRIQS